MLRSLLRLPSLAIVFGLALSTACVSGRQPELKVLSVEQAALPARDMVLYVEVTNPASRPLNLQRLKYSFASSAKVAGVQPVVGEVILSRIVEAGAAVIVEVPLTLDRALPSGEAMTLAGRLYATQDELQRSFAVSATIDAL